MFKILVFLLLIPRAEPDYDLAKIMTGLSPRQKTVLYQYGTLRTYSDSATATSYWVKHQTELNRLTKEQANILSADLIVNTELVYNIKQPSRLRALMGIFTASRLLMGAAALIAVGALLILLKRFWYRIYDLAVKYLAPVFQLLFSPKILKVQLLLIALIALIWGVKIQDLMFRTIAVQLGLVLLWTQLTAMTTRRRFHRLYWDSFRHNFRDFNVKEVLLQITMPSLTTVLAMGWLIYVCEDAWYPFEISVMALITLYSFPPVNWLLPRLSILFLPFPTKYQNKNVVLASYIVLTMILWVGLLFIPVTPVSPLVTITLLLIFLLLCFSVDDFFVGNSGFKNYIWVQLITIVYLCACVLVGSKLGVNLISWSGLGGLFLYVLIKYWEVPSLLGWNWEHRKIPGILGMALLIWGIAELMNLFPELFIIS
ncbi:hypothetical protein [Pedobacter cryoconitis]|uniref:Uncharacterized protein n=1 Tax=Pedobacter cryoconitis TaxID=188932 RepID=A0A7X0J6G7_9SPHI|nr:hypothetical protein [Pedobacter cryoconitis]MBB6500546.1 hypothetical protein [Pedobacter cryoconitis]